MTITAALRLMENGDAAIMLHDVVVVAARWRLLTDRPSDADLIAHLRRSFAPSVGDDLLHTAVEEIAGLIPADLERIIKTFTDEPIDEQCGTRILTIDEVINLPDPVPLVRGILNAGDYAMLYGAPGVAKSFVVLALSFAIAMGSPFAGHATEIGTVVYCALEGLHGFRRRILAALGEPIPADVRNRFLMIGSGVNLRNIASAGPLIASLDKLPEKPSLIVVDTLARASGGADENSAHEMGELIAACDLIRSRFGCAILLVHHPRKDGGTYRGSSAIEGALDVQMALTKTTIGGRTFVVLKSEKSKDEEPFVDLSFELQRIELDERDRWGRVQTSLRVVHSEPRTESLPEWYRGDPTDYAALTTILAFQGEPLTTAQLGEQLEVSGPTGRRHVQRLVKSEYVERTKSKPPRLLAGPLVPASVRGCSNG